MSKEMTTKESNQLYEIGFHIVGTIDSKKAADIVSEVKELISKNNGQVVKEGEISELTLAYTMIKKIGGKNHRFNQAYFDWIKFVMSQDHINEFKNTIDANQDILRFILIKTVDDYEHSTTKLADLLAEEEAKKEESEDEEIKEESTEEVVEESSEEEKEEKKASTSKTKSKEEEIDQAIDELVK